MKHEHLQGDTHTMVGWRLVICLLDVMFVFLVYHKIDPSNLVDGSRARDNEGRIPFSVLRFRIDCYKYLRSALSWRIEDTYCRSY